MKKTLLFFFLCCVINLTAQVTNEGQPYSWKLNTKSQLTAISIAELDMEKIRNEDEINDNSQAKPYRIGIPKKINFGLNNSGLWTQLKNGDRIWRILFHAKDAVHLSVVFDQFFIPKGGKLYLYNDERTDVLGAYTEIQNNEKQVLGTWLVNGEKLWIEYYEPKEVKDQVKLHLSSISRGYRLGNNFQEGYLDDQLKALNDSGDCNLDVDCNIRADFKDKRDLLKKAVVALVLPGTNGTSVCTGVLLNNIAEDKKAYILTANHCLGNSTPASYSIRFNWISPNPVCRAVFDSTDSNSVFTLSGATLRANNPDSDFMLLELFSSIPNDWDVTFAGWDRSDIDPEFNVGIHHPRGDIMKISVDNTGAIKAPHAATNSPVAQTWEITGGSKGGWEVGVTEGGSSGSALFDQNGRVIGQLYGGSSGCTGIGDNGRLDFYGRFATSWDTGTTADTRLKDWLNPQGGTAPMVLEAKQNVLAINDEVLDRNISVFPNPTSGLIQIKIKEWNSDLSYEVYDILGQTLLSDALQNNEIIDLDRLPDNIYFLKIKEVDTNRSIVKKIILKK